MPPSATTEHSIRPIFVVGMNGSGTGALARSLSQHPALYAFPGETRIFPHYLSAAAGFGDLNVDENFRRLLNDLRHNPAITNRHGQLPVPEPENWRDRERSLQSAMDTVFQYFATRRGKKRWVEKTPMNARHIEALAGAFPEARFIHIIRDGRDAALSFQRRFGYTPAMTIYRWKRTIRDARRQGASVGPERYLEVRYEALTEQPESVLTPVCAFIGEDFHSAMLNPTRHSGEAVIGSGGFQSNSGKWRRQLSARQLVGLERIAGKTLHELGYPSSNRTGDQDLTPARVRYYDITDRLRSGWRFARRLFGAEGKAGAKVMRAVGKLRTARNAIRRSKI